MNTRSAIESSSNPVALSASFNQDASCFAVGLNTGYRIFDTVKCDLLLDQNFNQGIGTVEMLEKTNFIALIGGGKHPKYPQNQVVIWDDSKQKTRFQIRVATTVRGVRLTKHHMVVALQNSIRVYKFQSKLENEAVYETADNPLGLCCLNARLLVFPGRTPGQVQLVDLATENVSIIPAHGSALRAIAISRDSEVLATASEKGTLIRVYATSTCARIAELRRGVDTATIYSLAIAPSGQILAVTSDKSTLHLFDIPHPSKPARTDTANETRRLTSQGGGGTSSLSEGDASQKWGFLGRIPLLPRVFSDVYSFASAHFEIGNGPNFGSSTPLDSLGDSGFRPPKGILGWTDDQTILILGAGRDGVLEKFAIAEGEDRKRYCTRVEHWKYPGKS